MRRAYANPGAKPSLRLYPIHHHYTKPVMIEFHSGDMFTSTAEAWVNPVNVRGVSGSGLALKFKKRFPENFVLYSAACGDSRVGIGKMFVTPCEEYHPKTIVNFPTKTDWRHPSKLMWISLGLKDLRRVVEIQDIRSIAIPALGCGLGGLRWADVRPLIVEHMTPIAACRIEIWEP